MTIKRKLSDIPESAVDEVVSDFESAGCTATKVKQADGLWTVTASCPESMPA